MQVWCNTLQSFPSKTNPEKRFVVFIKLNNVPFSTFSLRKHPFPAKICSASIYMYPSHLNYNTSLSPLHLLCLQNNTSCLWSFVSQVCKFSKNGGVQDLDPDPTSIFLISTIANTHHISLKHMSQTQRQRQLDTRIQPHSCFSPHRHNNRENTKWLIN